MPDVDTADHVLHGPTGEAWVVACVQNERLSWCGWPEGTADLADCTLAKKAAPEERDKLLREMADGPSARRERTTTSSGCCSSTGFHSGTKPLDIIA